jgi:hypothetical protein
MPLELYSPLNLKVALFTDIAGYRHPASIKGIAHDKIEAVTALDSGPSQTKVHQPIAVPCSNPVIQKSGNKSVIVFVNIERDGIVTNLAGQRPGLQMARKFCP